MTPKVEQRESSSMTPKVEQRESSSMTPTMTPKVEQRESASMTPTIPHDYTSKPHQSINCNIFYCPYDYRMYVTAISTMCLKRIDAPYDIIDLPSTPEGHYGGSYNRYYCPRDYTLVENVYCEIRIKAIWNGCYTVSPTMTPYPSRKIRTYNPIITNKPNPSYIRISPKSILKNNMILKLSAVDSQMIADNIGDVQYILSQIYDVPISKVIIKSIRRKIIENVWNITVVPKSRQLEQIPDQTFIEYNINVTNPTIVNDVSPILSEYFTQIIDPDIVQQFFGNVSINDIIYQLYSIADEIETSSQNNNDQVESANTESSTPKLINITTSVLIVGTVLTALITAYIVNKRNKLANIKKLSNTKQVPIIKPNNIVNVDNKVFGIHEYPPIPNGIV